MLDEPLPPGTGWFFTLGSVLLALLSIQLLTGAFLTLYYAATPDHAYDSVRFINSLRRGQRSSAGFTITAPASSSSRWSAHMLRVIAFGSYKPPREVTWLSGLALLGLILGFALTGYLLPWDQRAYWATVVTINISKLTPLAGEMVAGVLRGGSTIGALTLTRWYSAHVIFLPAVLVLLIVGHLFLMRRQGISGPVRARAGSPPPFFPSQAARDVTMVLAGRDRARCVRVARRAAARRARRSDRRDLHSATGVVFPRAVSAAEILPRQVGSRRRDGGSGHRRRVPRAAAVDRSRSRSRSASSGAHRRRRDCDRAGCR